MRGAVLVVDDDVDAAEALAESLRARGFRATPETDPARALESSLHEDLDVVLTDLRMHTLDGLALCDRIAATRPDLPVILMTGHASVEVVVRALRAGAFDFIVKPADPEILALDVERAVKHHRLHSEVHRLRNEVAGSHGLAELRGESTAMRQVLDLVRRIAPLDATVLITGESGTGKELVARAVHAHSPRRDGPFVAINCAAVPANLLESELFGHARGAFTDAKVSRRGLFLDAQGGTLFLDEIGEMPLEMQVKLLRALQERTVRAVGGNTETTFDARIVAATNRNLEDDIAEKRFREDLYYRIHVCPVYVPPLREREGDVAVLARTFVTRFADKHHKGVNGITAPALAKLVQYGWPGNVRELENGIERAVAMAQHDRLVVEDLPERVRASRVAKPSLLPATLEELITMDELKRRYMRHVLELVGGNKSRAARILGFDRRTFYRELGPDGEPIVAKEGNETERGEVPTAPSEPPRPEPRAEPAVAGTTEPIPVPVATTNETPSRSPGLRRSVLVVDDDHDALETVQVLLESRGYVVSTATGIADAMRTHGVDVVLTDLHFADGSGRDLVGRFGNAPVLAMTADTVPGSDAGFSRRLDKPVSLAGLTRALAAVLPPL